MVVFISRCENESFYDRILTEGFELITVERSHPDKEDLSRTLAILKRAGFGNSESWCVLDGYHFDSEYQKAIRDSGFRLLVLDDVNHLPYYQADIILNQNINAESKGYACDDSTVLLLGARYALLRSEFLQYKGRKRLNLNIARKILVTMGSSDSHNVSLTIIRALKQIDIRPLEARIIIGPANPNIGDIQGELLTLPFDATLLQVVDHMPALLAWADVAVTAAGSTCWELAFMGVPSLTVITAHNQEEVAEELDKSEICTTLGWWQDMVFDTVVDELEKLMSDRELRRKKARLGKELIDGRGSETLVRILSGEADLPEDKSENFPKSSRAE